MENTMDLVSESEALINDLCTNAVELVEYVRRLTVKHVYFIAETKGSMNSMQLREIEKSKIHCVREHFRAISGGNVVYDVVDSFASLLEKVMK